MFSLNINYAFNFHFEFLNIEFAVSAHDTKLSKRHVLCFIYVEKFIM